MDNNESSVPRRKPRFIPRGQSSRKREQTVPTPEVGDEDVDKDKHAQSILRHFNENARRRRPKVQKKSSVQVAFGPGGDTSTSMRTFGTAKDGNSGKGSSSGLKGSDDEQSLPTSLPAIDDEMDIYMEDATDVAPLYNVKKKHVECWDFEHTYYPTTLPLRKPNSGDPEILNENEFGKDAEEEYDESTINPASELGLLDDNQKEKLVFVQLPNILPLTKRSATAKGKEKVGSSTSLESVGAPKKGCNLEELSGGYMGKMLVYKSGAIKLKLGDTLYDVSSGSKCTFAQDVAVLNCAKKECCVVGELKHRAVVTPNVDFLLDVIKLD